MSALSRQGDLTTTGGTIMNGAKTVFASGQPVGLNVSQITPHAPWGKAHPPHAAAITLAKPTNVFCEGMPVLSVGISLSCGHEIIQGSPTIFVP